MESDGQGDTMGRGKIIDCTSGSSVLVMEIEPLRESWERERRMRIRMWLRMKEGRLELEWFLGLRSDSFLISVGGILIEGISFLFLLFSTSLRRLFLHPYSIVVFTATL